MSIPATPITYSLSNNSLTDIDIKNITYVDNSNIQHHADYSNFYYGGSDSTANTSAEQFNKIYLTGDYLEKSFVRDTHARTVFYTTHTGATVTFQDSPLNTTDGIQVGWAAAGTGFAGLYVQQVISTTVLILTGTPTVNRDNEGQSVIFSTSDIQIVLENTEGLAAGWSIINNGYNAGDNAVIVSKVGDNATLNVNVLPVSPAPGNKMLFTKSTNYLTLNNTNNLEIGNTANGNGYNDSQSIIDIIDGNTVQMSGIPSSTPSTVNPYITFTSNRTLYTLASGETITFSLNYENNTSNVGTNFYSDVTLNAVQDAVPIVAKIYNYVNIDSPPAPPPAYIDILSGDGTGGDRGGGYTAPADPGTVSMSISNEGMASIGANFA